MQKDGNLIVIGSSTGGPKALSILFSSMPRLNASFVIVQHMPKFINESFRRTLDRGTDMDVRLADRGSVLEAGTVYLAPSEVHLKLLNNRKISLSGTDKVNYVCPSVDTTMLSVKAGLSNKVIGIILTGMGCDGAQGIGHIKDIGGKTYAQSEESCAVYGMPKAAYNTGAVDSLLTPDEIRSALASEFGVLR